MFLFFSFFDNIILVKKMAEKIDEIINNVKKEISIVNEVSGLCYYAANNIYCDLRKNNIKAEVYDIKEIIDIDYSHYFVLAYENENNYLIDVTYSQFVKTTERPRFFQKWPGEILENNNKELLKNLLKYGYAKINNNDLYDYLKSFSINFIPIFTLKDLKER